MKIYRLEIEVEPEEGQEDVLKPRSKILVKQDTPTIIFAAAASDLASMAINMSPSISEDIMEYIRKNAVRTNVVPPIEVRKS